jgi:MFS family permease
MTLPGTRQQWRGVASSPTGVFALCLGNAVQWYDFALYGAFATILGPVFFPSENPSTVLLAAFATYGTALIIRPVGALLFGRMADVHGRRAVFVPVILLMAGATADWRPCWRFPPRRQLSLRRLPLPSVAFRTLLVGGRSQSGQPWRLLCWPRPHQSSPAHHGSGFCWPNWL